MAGRWLGDSHASVLCHRLFCYGLRAVFCRHRWYSIRVKPWKVHKRRPCFFSYVHPLRWICFWRLRRGKSMGLESSPGSSIIFLVRSSLYCSWSTRRVLAPNGMSLPASEFWFSPVARRNRKSFILASLLLTGVLFAVGFGIWFFDATGNHNDLILITFFIPYVLCQFFLTAQRFRDMNLTGWLALLWVPVGIADKYVGGAASIAFLIILCAVPGTKGTNQYGADPLGSSP